MSRTPCGEVCPGSALSPSPARSHAERSLSQASRASGAASGRACARIESSPTCGSADSRQREIQREIGKFTGRRRVGAGGGPYNSGFSRTFFPCPPPTQSPPRRTRPRGRPRGVPRAGEVAVDLDRPKNADHGDFATNVAMQLAKRCAGSRARSRRRSSPRCAASELLERPEIAGPGLHQLPPVADCALRRGARRSSRRARPSAAAAAGAGRTRRGGVRLGQSDRPAARRPRPPGGARRRDLHAARVAGLERDARVLLQRRRRADRQPRAVGAGALAAATRGERSRCPRTATTATTSARSRATTCAAHSGDADGRRPRRDPPVRGGVPARASRISICSAFGVKFDTYFLETSLYTDGKVEETVRR